MDQVHVVRHKVLVEGRSSRQVAEELGLSRNTVRRYLTRAAPVRVESEPRPRPVFERVHARLEALLADSPRWTGGKQRLTATQAHRMLLAEGFSVGQTLVKQVVAEWRRKRREVFVPLVYAPGELAQVDFFEVLVDVAGQRRKAWMFVMRSMASGRDFVRLYDRQDQPCFLDGHVRAFEHFGAVPQRIAYDNLRAAVRKLLVGAERVLAPRFEALASHYLFEASFCRPGTGHDKGGVESRGRAIRLEHLVPIPAADTLDDIRVALLARLDAAHDAARFALDRSAMLPLPAHAFDARRKLVVGASRSALCKIEGAHYSVPCRWAGLDVTAYVAPDEVVLVRGAASVAHARARFGGRSVDYRHYVPELAAKPQAVRQVAAELIRDLGAPFDAAWRHLVDVHGPREAARVFAKVLGHVETRGIEPVRVRLRAALASGEPILLALAPPAPSSPALDEADLPTALRSLDVASGRAADYDRWLRGGVA